MKLNSLDSIDLSNNNYITPYLETATTSANLKAYGVSTISYSSAANKYTLSAPITGVEKTIVLNSTLIPDSTMINTYVYSGSTAIFITDGTTGIANNLYINIQPPFANVKLIGLSTSQWGVISKVGAVQFSTAATYSS